MQELKREQLMWAAWIKNKNCCANSPQYVVANRLYNATFDVSFLYSYCKWQWFINNLSSVIRDWSALGKVVMVFH